MHKHIRNRRTTSILSSGAYRRVLGLAIILLLAIPACQTGEILTPPEATARAQQATKVAITPQVEPAEGLRVGDVVRLTARGYIVNLMDQPGGSRIVAFQERGSEVTILQLAQHEGERWYRVDSAAGKGWISEDNIDAGQGEGAPE